LDALANKCDGQPQKKDDKSTGKFLVHNALGRRKELGDKYMEEREGKLQVQTLRLSIEGMSRSDREGH